MFSALLTRHHQTFRLGLKGAKIDYSSCLSVRPSVRMDQIGSHGKNFVKFENCAFWDITQRVVVISYRLFETTYRSYLQESKFQKKRKFNF